MPQLPVIIIPAYQPDNTLVKLIKDLDALASLSLDIIVVNDGSTTPEAQKAFQELDAFPNVTVLEHAENQGKGAALKTAFNHFLKIFPARAGVITADADGQHLPTDILKMAEALQNQPGALWLGTRQFSPTVPFRSRFGNLLTGRLFRFFSSYPIHDTQTGLRSIPRDFLMDVVHLPENGYEFEMQMLMLATERKLPISELPIETVYIEQNRSSHFHPVMDSLKIYFVFLRYALLSAASAALDLLLFLVFFHLEKNIVYSIISARILSGTFNFVFCKTVIFKSSKKAWPEALGYTLLALISVSLSCLLTSYFYHVLRASPLVSKVIADGLIFISNFLVQKYVIFRHKSRQDFLY